MTTVNGSTSVVGVGTAWHGQVKAGDIFTVDRATYYKILAVDSDTALTLVSAYTGPTGAGQIYAIVLDFSTASLNYLAAATALLTPGDRVTSVFNRVGAIAAESGDYQAGQIPVTPSGGITATDVQGALVELDADKAALAGANFTGNVTLAAGSTETAPLTLTPGPALEFPDLGAVEFDGANVFVTVGARKTIAYVDSNITGNAANVTGVIAVDHGGTGATNATAALANIGGAPLVSPGFLGAPTAPTPAGSDNSTNLATTAFVKGQGYITAAGAPVQSVAGKTGVVTLVVADVSGAAPLASPALTGTPTAPTAPTADSSTALATTAFVKGQGYITAAGAPVQSVAGKTGVVTLVVADVSGAAPLASPALTGAPTAPTAPTADSSTALATTAFVKAQGYVTAASAPVLSVAGKTGNVTLAVGDVAGAAPLASPALTGTPTAPTASAGNSSTLIATTAFVANAAAGPNESAILWSQIFS